MDSEPETFVSADEFSDSEDGTHSSAPTLKRGASTSPVTIDEVGTRILRRIVNLMTHNEFVMEECSTVLNNVIDKVVIASDRGAPIHIDKSKPKHL